MQILRIILVLFFSIHAPVFAAKPVFIISAIQKAPFVIGSGQTATATYRVTNNTPFLLENNGVYHLPQGVTQLIAPSTCGQTFTLATGKSCILQLLITADKMTSSIFGGPAVCQNLNHPIYCSAPGRNDSLNVKLIAGEVLRVTNSPLLLTAGGSDGELIIENTSSTLTVTNIAANFTGTALEGNITQDASNCAVLAPRQSCTLVFTPGNTDVPLTNFSIEGDGTKPVIAAIAIELAPTIVLSLTGSPLILDINGLPGSIKVMNMSHTTTATNISANFSGTALDGNVTQDASNCAVLLPRQQCTLTFTPGNTAVPGTAFPITGSNTIPTQGSITINGSGIVLSNQPLELERNGPPGNLIITNTSNTNTAHDISADISGTDLVGKVTITGNTCASVAPGASCQITFTPGSSAVKLTSFVIQGSDTNAVLGSVTIDQWIYIGTFNLTTALRCVVSGITGGINNCITTGSGLASSVAVMINPAGTFAYVSRYPAGEVVKCEVASDGQLINCAPTANMPGPQEGAVHPNGTKIYIPNNFTNSVTLCDINNNGDLTNCQFTGSGFSTPAMVTLDPGLKLAYVSNPGSNTISQCTVAGDYSFINCIQNSDPTFSAPTGINFDPLGANAYITNSNNSTISRCDVSPTDGTLSNCNITGAGFNGFGNAVINDLDTFAYISSLSPSGVNLCPVLANGNLSASCTFFSVFGTAFFLTLF